MFDINILGTRHLLDFSIACGAKKFLLASSGAVYGRQPPGMENISETFSGAPDPADPLSAYGEAKRGAELLCAIYAGQYGISTKIARCFAFSGPHLPLDAHFAFGNFIRDALRGGPVHVTGDGTALRSYLYSADLAIWIWTILFNGVACRPYNVGSEEAVSIAGLARSVADAFRPGMRVDISKKHEEGQAVDRYIPSCARAREIGLFQRVSLSEQTRRTIEWHVMG